MIGWRAIRQTLWSLDALLLVLAYTACLLILPIKKSDLPVAGR
jgi:hypothetical protein